MTDKKQLTKKELEDLLKRVQADFENYRKRVEQDEQTIRQFANANLLIDLLPVLDNFRRAAGHLPENLKDDVWAKGVQAIERQLEEILRQHALTPIEVKPGDRFDANLHEAVSNEAKGTLPHGIVKQVIEQGYLLSGKVLRPTKVVVS